MGQKIGMQTDIKNLNVYIDADMPNWSDIVSEEG